MALVDMFQVVHRMTQFGKRINNIYHVERANAGETAGAISDAFQNDILPALRALQNDSVVNDELYITNLGDSTDFGTFTLTGALGLRPGAGSPKFVSGALRFPTIDRDIRNGYKRFGGMQESDYEDGVLNAAAVALIEAVGDAMIANWTASADSHHVCNYVIIKRVCETFDPNDPTKCIEYRLPETDVELKFFTPNQRICQSDVTSQVSRK